MWVRAGLDWSLLSRGILFLGVLTFFVILLRAERRPFKKKLQVRRAKEQEAGRRRALLEHSVRAHLLPALVQLGFEPAAPRSQDEPYDRKHAGCFPIWGQFARARESIVDKVEIQFSTYGRAAFRINATAVPESGMMTAGGHRAAEEIHASGLHDHLETHARPWLRPILKGLRVEPLGEWFSLWRWPLGRPTESDYDRLAQSAAAVLPELEVALRDGKLGPHIRRLEFEPFPPDVLERIAKMKAERAAQKS